MEQGRFRLDLYYRLHGVDVQVPPLRARREDITELARYFLERHRFVRQLQLSTAAADALLVYDWPGNVRELERVIERAVALAGSDSLELDDLPPAILGGYSDVLVPSMRARESMRAWASRYARLVYERSRQQQASDLPRAGDLLPHAAGRTCSSVRTGPTPVRQKEGSRKTTDVRRVVTASVPGASGNERVWRGSAIDRRPIAEVARHTAHCPETGYINGRTVWQDV